MRYVPAQARLVFIGCFCFLAMVSASFGQGKPQTDPLNTVPEQLRAGLSERLALFVEDYRTKRWDKLYDLLTDDFNVGTRKDFVKARKESPWLSDSLLSFELRVVFDKGSNEFEVAGCSKWLKRGEAAAAIFAYRRNNEWYFSVIALYLQVRQTGSSASMNRNDTFPCSTSHVSGAFAFQ
jgi:hypothetical protein